MNLIEKLRLLRMINRIMRDLGDNFFVELGQLIRELLKYYLVQNAPKPEPEPEPERPE